MLLVLTRPSLSRALGGQVVGSWAFVIHGGLFRDTNVTLDDLRKVYQAPAPASPDPYPYPYP